MVKYIVLIGHDYDRECVEVNRTASTIVCQTDGDLDSVDRIRQ